MVRALVEGLYCGGVESGWKEYKRANNCFLVLEKIISSTEHFHIQDQILLHLPLFYQVSFAKFCCLESFPVLRSSPFYTFSRVTCSHSLKLLANFSLMTLGGFREIEESLITQFTSFLFSHLPLLKSFLKEVVKGKLGEGGEGEGDSEREVRRGKAFLQISICSLVESLLISQNEQVEEKLLEEEIVESLVELLFTKERNNLLQIAIFSQVLLPVFEDQREAFIEKLIHNFSLLSKLSSSLNEYCDSKGQTVSPPKRNPKCNNGVLIKLSNLLLQLEVGKDNKEWKNFVKATLSSINKLEKITQTNLPHRPNNTKKDGSLNLSKIVVDV